MEEDMRPWVVKLGGEVLDDLDALAEFGAELCALHKSGRPIVMVHGGGAQTTALMKTLGLEPTFVGGRRVTSAETLEAVKMAIAGKVSVDLCAALVAAGLPALGLNGVSAGLIRAEKRPPRLIRGGGDKVVDLGFVGDVHEIRSDLIRSFLEHDLVPVIACVASDAHGVVLNINADVVATDLAVALRAELLVALSGVSGVLTDPSDPSTRLSRINRSEVTVLVDRGVIAGGMVAKVDEALRGLELGVPRVVVTGPVAGGVLRASTGSDRSMGTEIVEDPVEP
jgi:acetylglutamate kinase